jgi:hypothetical protein
MSSTPAPVLPVQTIEKETQDQDRSTSPSPAQSDKSSISSFNPGWRFFAAFSTLSVITLAAALDATTLGTALPIISKAINGTAIEAFWAGTSFLLTSTVFQPIYASFSHIFGRKPLVSCSFENLSTVKRDR